MNVKNLKVALTQRRHSAILFVTWFVMISQPILMHILLCLHFLCPAWKYIFLHTYVCRKTLKQNHFTKQLSAAKNCMWITAIRRNTCTTFSCCTLAYLSASSNIHYFNAILSRDQNFIKTLKSHHQHQIFTNCRYCRSHYCSHTQMYMMSRWSCG